MSRGTPCHCLAVAPLRSLPIHTISPCVAGMRLRMARDKVDLPQPDSPTTPSVSPAFRSKLTPSTAFSVRDGAHCSLLFALTLKCTWTSRTDRMVCSDIRYLVQRLHLLDRAIAGSQPGGVAAKRFERRDRVGATLACIYAALLERTARRRMRHIRRITGNADERRIALIEPRQCAQQTDGIGMRRTSEQVVLVALFRHASAVHHHHLLAQAGDHAEVVRDQHDRRAEVVLQVAQQLKYLRLDRDVERGGWFVGKQHLRLAQ